MGKLNTALKVFLVYAIFLGIFYPLLITGISFVVMHDKAEGSLIKKNGEIIGSKLIAQEFNDPGYFHSRFSFINYNAANSGASNFAPSNQKFLAEVAERIDKVRMENGIPQDKKIPADMVLASGSGLDPHISIENARLQLPRVAAVRGLPKEKIDALIKKNIDRDFVGIWGDEGVNVLLLNLDLDSISTK